MKLILPIFLIIFSTLELSGQKLARGYYVDLNNDSIPAMFKIPRRMPDYLTDIFGKQMDFPNLKEEIEIVDHRGQVQRLTPRDIKSFAFTHGATEYKRHAKPVTEYNKKFLLPEIMGKKLRLYHYAIVHPGTAHHWNGSTAKGGSSPYKEYFWTFEKYDRSYLFLNSKMKKKEIVRKLKEFFHDSPRIQELVDQKFKSFTFTSRPDLIRSIVESYNE